MDFGAWFLFEKSDFWKNWKCGIPKTMKYRSGPDFGPANKKS